MTDPNFDSLIREARELDAKLQRQSLAAVENRRDGGGLHRDEGKLPWHLLPHDAVAEVVGVLQYGSQKYEPNNWRRGMQWSRLFSSCMRHLLAWFRGETIDPESGRPHLAHLACNALFLIWYEQQGLAGKLDDRPKYAPQIDIECKGSETVLGPITIKKNDLHTRSTGWGHQ